MSKKILILAVILFIAVIIYCCINTINNKKTTTSETETTTETDISEISYSSENHEDINNIIIENNSQKLEFVKSNNGNFIINGYDDVTYNDGIINSLLLYASNLKYSSIIENPNNLSEYGLESPALKTTISYKDGSKRNITIGDRTQDLSYYYVMFDNNKSVYISSINNYNLFFYNLSDFIYKYIPAITRESIMYLDVSQKNKDEIEIAFVDKKTGNAADLASYGMQTLTMFKPLAETAVYPTNLQETVLSNISLLSLDEVYKLNPTDKDMADCGFNSPFLTIDLIDGNKNTVSLTIGNEADENSYYCVTPLYPHIFTIQKNAIEPFINIDILDFTDKFIQLINRKLVSSIDFLENNEKKYDVKFNGTDKSTVENQKDTRITTINNKEIAYEDFGKFYQVFAGITFDSFVSATTPTGTPEIEFIIHLTDGSQKSIKYFNYDKDINFYLVQEDDLQSTKLVSKRGVKEIFTKANELTAN